MIKEFDKKVVPLHPKVTKRMMTNSERKRTHRIVAELIARRVINDSGTFQYIVDSEIARLETLSDVQVIVEFAEECDEVKR